MVPACKFVALTSGITESSPSARATKIPLVKTTNLQAGYVIYYIVDVP